MLVLSVLLLVVEPPEVIVVEPKLAMDELGATAHLAMLVAVFWEGTAIREDPKISEPSISDT